MCFSSKLLSYYGPPIDVFFNLGIYLNTSLAARHKVTSLTTWKRGLLAVDDLEAGLAWQGATVAAVLLIPLLLLLGVGRCCRR